MCVMGAGDHALHSVPYAVLFAALYLEALEGGLRLLEVEK